MNLVKSFKDSYYILTKRSLLLFFASLILIFASIYYSFIYYSHLLLNLIDNGLGQYPLIVESLDNDLNITMFKVLLYSFLFVTWVFLNLTISFILSSLIAGIYKSLKREDVSIESCSHYGKRHLFEMFFLVVFFQVIGIIVTYFAAAFLGIIQMIEPGTSNIPYFLIGFLNSFLTFFIYIPVVALLFITPSFMIIRNNSFINSLTKSVFILKDHVVRIPLLVIINFVCAFVVSVVVAAVSNYSSIILSSFLAYPLLSLIYVFFLFIFILYSFSGLILFIISNWVSVTKEYLIKK